MKLYEIAAEFRAVAAILAEAGGELTPDLSARLDAAERDITAKSRNIVGMIREEETAAAVVQSEIDRLEKLRDSHTAEAARWHGYLETCLRGANVKTLDVGIAKLWLQRASRPSIRWAPSCLPGDAAGYLPAEFERIRPVVRELDGNKAYEAYRAGKLPAGFDVQFSESLIIR